jgi:hypothetical protein
MGVATQLRQRAASTHDDERTTRPLRRLNWFTGLNAWFQPRAVQEVR